MSHQHQKNLWTEKYHSFPAEKAEQKLNQCPILEKAPPKALKMHKRSIKTFAHTKLASDALKQLSEAHLPKAAWA